MKFMSARYRRHSKKASTRAPHLISTRMEMHQVRYFVALSEELNFTRAAIRCHVSQPALTRAIKALEAELGGPLLRRERGNTHLTELGALMLPYIRSVQDHADAARDKAEAFHAGIQRLRLGVMCTIAPAPLLSLVATMSVAHPGVALEITDATAITLERELLGGGLDVALYCRPATHDDKLHYLKIFDERMVIVLPPGDPLTARPSLRLSDLDDHRYLNRTHCEFNGSGILGACGATWNAVYSSERDDWILAMVAAGLGFSFLPEHSVTHPGVIARPLVDPEVTRDVAIVSVRGRPHTAAAGALVREAMRNGWSGSADHPLRSSVA